MGQRMGTNGEGGVAASWARIEAWLAANAPAIRASLRGGATEDRIRAAAQVMDATLPVDVVESYGIHDGQSGGPPLFGTWWLLSLDGMTAEWSTLKEYLDDGVIGADAGEPIGPIREDWWHTKWIPVAHNNAGDYRCVDLAPEPSGHEGQVIAYWHADPRREVLAADFATWLRQFADDIEAGHYRVENERLKRAD
jgi:cell wall assembly regulator SMI1